MVNPEQQKTKRIDKSQKQKFRNPMPSWNFVEYGLVRLTTVLINAFPIAVSTWIARRIGDALFLIISKRRKIVLENLAIAFGNDKADTEKRRLALESFRHLTTCLMEFFRLPKFVKISAQHIRFKGTEYLDRAFIKAKGVILVMSHLGPWEYLGFLTYLKKYPTTVLGRAIRNPYFYRWVKSLRKIVNLNYSDKTMGAREIFSELKANHLVAITIDQWAGNEELWTDFFGRAASTTSLPARLARKTGCALIPAYCIRVASGEYEIHVEPEACVRENVNNWTEKMTRELNYLLEQQIRAFPEQWLWTHRRWKGKKNYK